MVATDLIRKEKKYKINKSDLDSSKTSNQTNSSDDENNNFLKTNNDLKNFNDCSNQKTYKIELVWKNIMAFVGMHVVSVYGLYHFFRQESYKPIYIRELELFFFIKK